MVHSETLESVVVPYVVKTEGSELSGQVSRGGSDRSGQGRTSALHTDHIPKTAGERWVIANESSKLLRRRIRDKSLVGEGLSSAKG